MSLVIFKLAIDPDHGTEEFHARSQAAIAAYGPFVVSIAFGAVGSGAQFFY